MTRISILSTFLGMGGYGYVCSLEISAYIYTKDGDRNDGFFLVFLTY